MLMCLNFIGPMTKHVTLVFKNIFLFYQFFLFSLFFFLLILLDIIEVELSDDENKAFIVKVEALHRECRCFELMMETSIPMLSSISLVQIIPQFELFGSFWFKGGGFALWWLGVETMVVGWWTSGRFVCNFFGRFGYCDLFGYQETVRKLTEKKKRNFV